VTAETSTLFITSSFSTAYEYMAALGYCARRYNSATGICSSKMSENGHVALAYSGVIPSCSVT